MEELHKFTDDEPAIKLVDYGYSPTCSSSGTASGTPKDFKTLLGSASATASSTFGNIKLPRSIGARDRTSSYQVLEKSRRVIERAPLNHQRRSSRTSKSEDDMTLEELRSEVKLLRAELASGTSKGRTDECDLQIFWPRAKWLIALLLFQSTSSFILQIFHSTIESHPTLVYFLTMLVGAGGNAGGQSTVLIVRGLALDPKNPRHKFSNILRSQCFVAMKMAFLLSIISWMRCRYVQNVPIKETVAISMSMFAIVSISILIGSCLPLVLRALQIDPAHAGAAIQVIMDIVGVSLTCIIGHLILSVVDPPPQTIIIPKEETLL